ncbi:MAG: hypothetical protein E7269_03000 [Lachnospiraceae bacterium]|nr:hypothetical protein [Lachnospiraceae bacterium]
MTKLHRNEITTKLKRIITINPILKLVAVLIAILLWIVVVNVSDPDYIVTVRSIPVELVNDSFFLDQDKAYDITNQDISSVSVTIKGPRSIVENLEASDFQATANLKNFDSTASSVPIEISLLGLYSSYQNQIEYLKRPYTLWLSLEDITEVTYDVQVETRGTLEDAYIAGKPILSSSKVVVKAPLSVHETIGKVGVHINIDNAAEDVTLSGVTPVIYSTVGGVISTSKEVSVLSTVDVTVPVYYTKTVPVMVEITGECAAGYEVTGVAQDKNEVLIHGSKQVLDLIDNIAINGESVSIEDLAESKDFVLNIADYLPEGVGVSNTLDETVTVSVTIESVMQKTITISKSEIMCANVPKEYLVEFADENAVRITLRGLKADLDSLDEEMLNPYVDLENIGVGSSAVKLNITLPEGVTMDDEIYIVMVIKEAESGEVGGGVTPPETEEPTTPQEEPTTPEEEPTPPPEEELTTPQENEVSALSDVSGENDEHDVSEVMQTV